MPNSLATIQCSNIHCQASNPQNNKFCLRCSTPILKRYLWMIGQGDLSYPVGELIGDRYLVKHPRIVLDTKPSQTPSLSEEIPPSILPYLKLFPYRLHIPQIHGKLPNPKSGKEVWLLSYNSVLKTTENFTEEALFPSITKVWSQKTGLRQLNWLWQIANLWKPLKSRGVVSTLLTPKLLGINGPIVQLIELHKDFQKPPSLRHLGEFWTQLIPQADENIKEFLEELCQKLQSGEIHYSQHLIDVLDQALQQYGKTLSRSYKIFTSTDSGRSRDHNEDSCYPEIEKLVTSTGEETTLAIVCDGIGGHEGGEIASQLAIDSLQKNLENINFNSTEWNPTKILESLEQFVCQANDLISERNDEEQRHERQRMGTTLVMSFAHGHEMYLTHVGDSRIYWITKHGCHTVTVDDDLASREVRLGYALYADAVKYPSAGALVQALGMGSSSMLHPTVQRLTIDENCVFLLCSDGLSDFDRVDQHWENEILPVLENQRDLAAVGKKLIQIGNERNGHDNITIALVSCQVKPQELTEKIAIPWEEIKASYPESVTAPNLSESIATGPREEMDEADLDPDPEPITREQSSPKSILIFIALVLICSSALTALLLFFFPEFNSILNPEDQSNPAPTPTPTVSVTNSTNLEPQDIIKITQEISLNSTINPDNSNQDGVTKAPQDTVIKIISQPAETDPLWLNIKVCSSSNPMFKTNQIWYIKKQDLQENFTKLPATDPEAKQCGE